MTAHIEYFDSIKIAKRRAADSWGAGHYKASRGGRYHKGIDYQVPPGSLVCAPIAGEITKLGYCYGDDISYRYVQIEFEDGHNIRIFYVAPSVDVGQRIERGEVIGTSQGLDRRYAGITEHVHLEILRPDGSDIDPDVYFS